MVGWGCCVRGELGAAVGTGDVNAVAAAFGPNCGGMNQTVSAAPRIGTSVQYQMTGGYPWSMNLLAFGFSDTVSLGVPLPLNLVPYGALPGCFALCSSESIDPGVAAGAGAIAVGMTFPKGSRLLGT